MYSLVPHRMLEEVEPLFRWADDLGRWPAVVNRCFVEPLCDFGKAEVHNTDQEFRIRMDMDGFTPSNVEITSDNKNRITIHAKHEEKQDKHGFISREITRTFKLPDNVDPKTATSTMNKNGALIIKIGKKCLEDRKEVPIPIQFKE